jgi:hypothetical protein
MASRKPPARPRTEPFPDEDVDRARAEVAATLTRKQADTSVDGFLDLYDYLRRASPGHTAVVSDAIENAIKALEVVKKAKPGEFLLTRTLPDLESLLGVLRIELSMRQQASLDALRRSFVKLILEGQGIPHAREGAWRQRFAFLSEDNHLGPTNMARVEALAVIRGDALLESHTDPGMLYFEDADAAVQRWKTLCSRRRHAEGSSGKRKQRSRGGT